MGLRERIEPMEPMERQTGPRDTPPGKARLKLVRAVLIDGADPRERTVSPAERAVLEELHAALHDGGGPCA